MLSLLARAQMAVWNTRDRAALALRNEKGEANVFAIIIGIVIVAVLIGGIFLIMSTASDTMGNKVQSCVSNPANC
jgi:hypothetical protein